MLGIPTQLIHTICVPLQLDIFDLALQSKGPFTTVYISEFLDTKQDIGVTKLRAQKSLGFQIYVGIYKPQLAELGKKIAAFCISQINS